MIRTGNVKASFGVGYVARSIVLSRVLLGGVLGVLVSGFARAGAVEIGDGRLSVVFSDLTGWPEEVRVAGETVLSPSKLPPFEPNAESFDVARTNGVWKSGEIRPLGICRIGGRMARSTVQAGPWRIECWVELHPDRLMVRRWYEISQNDVEEMKLRFFWSGFGRLSAEKGGEMFKPTGWPPAKLTVQETNSGEYCGWRKFPAMIVGGEKGWSAMIVPDMHKDYSDRQLGYVFADPTGWTLVMRHDIEGYVKRGVPQRFGDDWLVLRRGSAEDLLPAVRDWQLVTGQSIPSDLAPDIRQTVLYSHHPRGANEYASPRTNGLEVTKCYLPYLKALGVTTIWLRPIEDSYSIYCPRDYYKVDPRVGTRDEVRRFVSVAHGQGFKVWKDAVMHGGFNDSLRSKEHPEWLAWIDETGKTHHYWCYDYNWPTWVSYFADYVRNDTRDYGLDGWREDVPDGSKCPNWNPAIPYARASFSRMQGALAQQRGIRAAIRDVNPRGATLGEGGEAVFGNVSDSLYDQYPCHRVFPMLRAVSSETVAADYQRYLHEAECCFLPGQVFCRYPESHDSIRAASLYGRACANALMAACAWTRSYPLIHNGGEDGCFESWRRIFRLRRELPELADGSADYSSVQAPAGILAFLRSTSETKSVVLVNFNGRRTAGMVRWPGGRFKMDLPAFGYDVIRVKGPSVQEALGPELPAFEPDVAGELRSLPPITCGGWTVFRFPGATRWFAHAADGTSESPWFRRYAGSTWVTHPTKFGEHRPRRGCIRWTSTQHPFGLDCAHAAVGAIRGDRAMALTGLTSTSVVQVWESVEETGWEGVALAVKGAAKGVSVHEIPAVEALAVREPGAGDERLSPEPGGWRYETGGLRVRFLQSGAIVGIWRRDDMGWRKVAGTVGLSARLGKLRETLQQDDWNAAACFKRDDKGNLRFVVWDGALVPERKGESPKVRYTTELTFDDGDRSFGVTTKMCYDEKSARRAATLGGLSCEWHLERCSADGAFSLEGPTRKTCDPETRRMEVSVRCVNTPGT